MEKKQGFTYQELVSNIVIAVRRRAATIPAFRDSHNGCIRITMVPLCRDADEWLGGMSGFRTWLNGEEKDVCEREFIYKIDPRGSHTIQYVCEDGHVEPMYDGSVYATISIAEVDFIRLYVCTSGAKSDEDEQCSLCGMLAAQEYFRANLNSSKITPDFKSVYDGY